MSSEKYVISFYKRPTWVYIIGLVWLFIEVVMIQTAIASSFEREPRAAFLSWIIAAVLAAIYGAVWYRTAKK